MTTKTIIHDDPATCPSCGAVAQVRTCDGCGASARLLDCPCMAQPRPIAAGDADGHDPMSDYCETCSEAAAQRRRAEED
jgi:hypothetical protein